VRGDRPERPPRPARPERPPRPAKPPRERPPAPPPLRPKVDIPPDAARRGRAIVVSSWSSTVVFAATALPAAGGVDGLDRTAVVVSLALFAVSIPVWLTAIANGAVRTTRGELVDVPGLFFLAGSAPRRVVVHLIGSLVVALGIAVATVTREPFGFLEPMLPLGLIGLWGGRHGTFPPRPEPARRRVTDPKAKRPATGHRPASTRGPAGGSASGRGPADGPGTGGP
jgi:hypothetical protein